LREQAARRVGARAGRGLLPLGERGALRPRRGRVRRVLRAAAGRVRRRGGPGDRLRRRPLLPYVVRLLGGYPARRGEPAGKGAVTADGRRSYEGGFASVVFDCDSTLVRIEGIDELAGPRIDEVRRM